MIAGFLPPMFGSPGLRVEAWNGLVALAGEALPLAGGASASFRLSAPPPGDAWLTAFRFADGLPPVLVHIRDFPFSGLFNIELGIADIGALPDGLRQAMLEGMHAAIRNLLPPPYREAPAGEQGLASGFADLGASTMQWFDVRLVRPDGHAIVLDVGADRAAAIRLLADALSAAPAGRGPLAERISLPAEILLGSVELTLKEIGELEAGAVVVLPAGAEARVAIRVDNVLYQFERTGEGWRCLAARAGARSDGAWGIEMADGDALAAVSVGGEGQEKPVTVSSLRLAVDFDIGRLMVPVGTLSQWQPGALVELDPPSAGNGLEVTIRVNGDVIGQGDVVRIDDRLAVRITRLLLAPEG